MNNTIRLHNRDRAVLYLAKGKLVEPNIYEWTLVVDPEHEYVLKYCRYIMSNSIDIESIDPSGGPFISIGDIFENKYKIVQINSVKSIWISEGNYN